MWVDFAGECHHGPGRGKRPLPAVEVPRRRRPLAGLFVRIWVPVADALLDGAIPCRPLDRGFTG